MIQDNLQFVFACISTHSRWIKYIEKDVDILNRYFVLSDANKLHLDNFLKNSSRQLWISAILMEERRWREILPLIKYTVLLLGLDDLKNFWREYLSSFSLNERIPHSPILEANAFLAFLMTKNFRPSWKEIFSFEQSRNLLFDYKFSKTDSLDNFHQEYVKINIQELKAKLNPTLTLKSFNFTVSKMIKFLEKNSLNENSQYFNPEKVAFYKIEGSGMVRSISLNDSTCMFLYEIQKHSNLLQWLNHVINKAKISERTALSFIDKMCANGLIYITRAG